MSEETEKNPLEVFLKEIESIVERVENISAEQSFTSEDYERFLERFYNIMRDMNTLLDSFSTAINKNISKIPNSIREAHKHGSQYIEFATDRFLENTEGFEEKISESFNKALKNVVGLKIPLKDEDKEAIANIGKLIKQERSNKILSIGTTILQGIVLIIVLSFSYKFYDTSVLSKEEMRQNILDDIQASNQGIYSKSYINALINERDIMDIWKNANPNDSKSYLEFRNQVIKNFDKEGIPYFESLTSDETSDGFMINRHE